jgi:hypothetical protein
MSEESFTISNGDRVWVPSSEEKECYKIGTVKEKANDSTTVFDEDYKTTYVEFVGEYSRDFCRKRLRRGATL